MTSLERALEQRGYTVLLCVGFGQRPDGTWSIKLAANPIMRTLTEPTWQEIRETIIKSMDQMRHTPLDDLEFED